MNLDSIYASVPVSIRTKLKRVMMAALKMRLKKFYAQFITEGSLIYDIGANDGDYADVFVELGGNVICVEPQPSYIAKLKKKFAGKKQISILQKGVGAKEGKLDFYISTFNSPNSSFSADFRKHSRYSYRKWDQIIQVQIITLQQMIQKYGTPDFCKIDVEGYEWEVLSSLKKPIPALSFEFLTEMNEKTNRIIAHLERLGKAKYNLCLGMSYKYELPKWISGKAMIALLNSEKAHGWNGDIYVKMPINTNK